ncbi:MAG: RHS repeat protein, partial [Planctomycetes bacterium]|nr:RHS repeat protein [Planctomycetota bacterium]
MVEDCASSDGTPDDFGGSGNLINQNVYDLFADPLHSDFRLRPGSALIDTGANLSADFTTDIAGNTRPASGPWDIGAFEYVQQIGGYDFCYSYDEVGNRTRMVDIDGNVTTYVYDPANQLT